MMDANDREDFSLLSDHPPPAKEELRVAVGATYVARAATVPSIMPNWSKVTAPGTPRPTSTLASSAAASASLHPTESL